MIPVEKNKEYEVEIESISSDGNGIAHIEGYTVFIPACAIGDRIRVKIVKVNKTYGFGRIEEILESSKSRKVPECAHYKRCGGCNLMHMDYRSQLDVKLAIVRDAISRIGGEDGGKVERIIGMNDIRGYRNKMVFPCDMVDGEIQFGFYANRSHDLVPIDDCFISDEISKPVLGAVKEYMQKTNTPVYDEKTKKGEIRRVFIRKGFSTGEVMVVICSAKKALRNSDILVELLRGISENIKSIVLNINTKPNNLVLGDKNVTLWGKDYIEDILCGFRYKISPHSFFQVNPVQTEVLYNTAIEMAGLTGNENLLDIYSGIGTISITASEYAKEVIGVEIVEQAVIDAKENAKLNSANNCSFYAGEAEKIVPVLMENGFLPDVAIIDPPRKGSDEVTLSALANSSVDRIVYVSCNPATLARDVRYLVECGFELDKAVAVDMFPNTCHVETVILMSRVDG